MSAVSIFLFTLSSFPTHFFTWNWYMHVYDLPTRQGAVLEYVLLMYIKTARCVQLNHSTWYKDVEGLNKAYEWASLYGADHQKLCMLIKSLKLEACSMNSRLPWTRMHMVIEACTCMNQSDSMQVKCFHLSVCMCPFILISIRSALILPKLCFVADVAGCQDCVCKTPVQKPNVLSLTMHAPSCKTWCM